MHHRRDSISLSTIYDPAMQGAPTLDSGDVSGEAVEQPLKLSSWMVFA